MAIGIPIKIVVLTIVGMAGLAAMLAFIDNGEGSIPKPIHADVKSSNLIILSAFNDTDDIDMAVEVMDSIKGTHLKKASVVLSGLGAASANLTNDNGHTILRFKKTDFDLKEGEGYLRLDVKANGFQDYASEFVIKIVK
ncbi:MAG: hypothetical protein OIN86_07840 [Candidatus Methanoperedens sp.]|nr:hypothetical protein [Candidatus Methanoperedens sp.]CAG0976195.1 hypothetical protein METP1_01517 [Methanosarcinales archaeon]